MTSFMQMVLYSNRLPVIANILLSRPLWQKFCVLKRTLYQVFIKRSSLYNWPLCQAFIYLLKQCVHGPLCQAFINWISLLIWSLCQIHLSIERACFSIGHCVHTHIFCEWKECEATEVFCFFYNQEGQRLLIVKFYINHCNSCIMMQPLRFSSTAIYLWNNLDLCDIVNNSELAFWKDIWYI